MALRTASELLDALDAGAMPAGDRDDGGDDGELGGVIFICSRETYDDTTRAGLFGLTQGSWSFVKRITPGMPLFLYNLTERRFHGVFEATSDGAMNADPTAWKTSGAGAGDAAGIDGSPYPAQVRYKHTRVTCSASAASCKPFLRFAAGEANGKKFRLDLTPGEATRLARVFHAGGDAGGGAKKGLNGKSGGGHHQTNGRAATPTHDVVDGWETVSSKKTTKKGGGGGSGGGSSPTTRRNNNNNGAAADGKDKIARGGKAAAGESYHHHHIHASSSALGDAADRASPPPPPPPPGPPRAPS
ncbi:uncharacterized protein MICPUCDRAFT_47799, partial [Micromonas pusilla CCMP1545]